MEPTISYPFHALVDESEVKGNFLTAVVVATAYLANIRKQREGVAY